MPIQTFKGKPGFGELLGTGISSGISKSLEALAKRKTENLQRRNVFNSLVDANVPPEVAAAVVNSPKSMQRGLLGTLMGLRQGGSFDEAQQPVVQGTPEQAVEPQLQQVPQQSIEQQQVIEPQQIIQQQDSDLVDLDSLFNLRKKVLREEKRSGVKKTKLSDRRLFQGLTSEARDIVFGKKLNDKIARFFLMKAKNNKEKARKLARKFGYKV